MFSNAEDNDEYKGLKEVRLDGIECTEYELESFLVGEGRGKILRILQLGGSGLVPPRRKWIGGITLSGGSFGGLIETIRRKAVMLDDQDSGFQVAGRLKGSQSGEEWCFDSWEDVKILGEFVLD